jgi:hypothetical protein
MRNTSETKSNRRSNQRPSLPQTEKGRYSEDWKMIER